MTKVMVGGGEGRMAELRLDEAKIHTAIGQLHGVGVAEGVGIEAEASEGLDPAEYAAKIGGRQGSPVAGGEQWSFWQAAASRVRQSRTQFGRDADDAASTALALLDHQNSVLQIYVADAEIDRLLATETAEV